MKPTTPTILLLAALGTANAETVFLNEGAALELQPLRSARRRRGLRHPEREAPIRATPLRGTRSDEEKGPLRAFRNVPTSRDPGHGRRSRRAHGLRRLTDEIATSAQGVARGVRYASFPPDVLALATSKGFRADRLYEVAEDAFPSKASRSQVRDALVWLPSPLARRKGLVEVGASRDFQAAIMKNPPSRARLELMERLDIASGTSEAAVEIQAAMMGRFSTVWKGRPRPSRGRSSRRVHNLRRKRAIGSRCRSSTCI